MNKRDQLQHYKETKGTPINTEGYTYVDSKQIQIRSVIEFMDALNYDYYPAFRSTFAAKYGCGFKGCETVSWSTACKLHDWQWTSSSAYLFVPKFSFVNKMDGGYFEKTFETDAYTLTKAQACKLVERVYVHCTKNGLLKAYKNQVKFVRAEYEEQFLKPIVDKEELEKAAAFAYYHKMYVDYLN